MSILKDALKGGPTDPDEFSPGNWAGIASQVANLGLWRLDVVTGALTWSDALFDLYGVDRARGPDASAMLAAVHPNDLGHAVASLRRAMEFGENYTVQFRLRRGAGSWRSLRNRTVCERDGTGRVITLRGVVLDVTELEANRVFIERGADVIVQTDLDRRITYISSNVMALSGYAPHEQIGMTIAEIAGEPVAAALESCVREGLTHPNQPPRSVEYSLRHRDGRTLWVESNPRLLMDPISGHHIGFTDVVRDITARKLALDEAQRVARFDGLTGLANRDVFVEGAKHACATAKSTGRSFAVLYLDLDHFKDVNDTLGHGVGDAVLRAVATRLRASAGDTDIVARLGDDEFAVIAEGVADPAAAMVLADALIAAVAAPLQIGGHDIRAGVSIGMDMFGPDAADSNTLLAHADLALHRAKAEGRGRARFFTRAMDTAARTRVALAAELRKAIATDQLLLVYQPQVSLVSGQLTGLEALVRWNHPKHGVLGPDLFIPIAEDMGLIEDLGHWVLWAACRQARAWLDDGAAPFRICVNVSALQFKAARAFEADVMAALAETGLPPDMVELELTESVLMDASREHNDVLRRLAKAGVTIAIDDFGTGYSSLGYLRRFPTDRIKIDQTFVRQLAATGGDAAIVKATIGLARELGIMAIAEGVETQEQRELLIGWGCTEAQGYYFARPLDAEVVIPLLRPGGPTLP